MLRYIVYFGCALFSLFFSITCPLYAAGEEPATALSPDGTLRTLAANAETWFRFDYGGSHSPLQIELTDSGLADIRFSLHTPEQLADWRRGLALKAIGQIARAGGVPEVIDDGQNGFLVKFGDTDAIAARILELLEHRALAERLGRHGHQKVLREMTWARQYGKVRELYQALTRRPTRA